VPSASDVSALARSLKALSAAASRDLAEVWASLPDPGDLAAVRVALNGRWPEIVAAYAQVGTSLAGDLVEVWAMDAGLRPKVVNVAPVDPERANARMGWAIGTDSQLGALTVLLDELVKQPARSLIQKSAVASGGAWARVPAGRDTCKWCLMLGSRGAVYTTEGRAGGDGRRFHGGDCDCQIVLVRDERDYPEGYDPDALMERYLTARDAADSGRPSAILSAWREAEGGH
jgi:alpha-D-ribose 1-methylphosphonate 5-triphosphate synthase subunit PhnG